MLTVTGLWRLRLYKITAYWIRLLGLHSDKLLAEEFQIAQLIINMRKAARLTQQELADRTGIKQPQLARIETGGQLPRLDTLANLAKEAGYAVEIHLIPQSQSGENTEILTPLSIAVTASI